MTRFTRRFVQFCALFSGAVAMGRQPIPARAEACATCKTATVCEVTYGGTDGCTMATGTCQQLGQACLGS
jgi:hypothetical protein